MSEIINKPIGIRCADIYLRFPEIMEDECDDLAEFLEDEHILYEGATDIFIDQKNKLNKQQEVLDKIKKYLNKVELGELKNGKAYTFKDFLKEEKDAEIEEAKWLLELLEEIE